MNIIIADDEPNVQSLLKVLFSEKKHKLFIVDNGKDVIELLKTQKMIDLIIMDYNMPVTNGLEVVEIMKANGYDNKVIVISGYELNEVGPKFAKHDNVMGYIAKPFDLSELKGLVEMV